MPKVANPKSKTKQIVAKPKEEWQTEFTAFKELCARNGLSMSQEIYERAIIPFLREHNWPPGNSQTLIDVFVQKKIDDKIVMCDSCGKEAVYRCRTVFPVKPVKNLCTWCTIRFEKNGEIISKTELNQKKK